LVGTTTTTTATTIQIDLDDKIWGVVSNWLVDGLTMPSNAHQYHQNMDSQQQQ
jgi:hypothetical protein